MLFEIYYIDMGFTYQFDFGNKFREKFSNLNYIAI